MVPLRPEAHATVLQRLGLDEGPGLLALRQALRFERPGLWADDAGMPRSVVLLRPAGAHREAFGAGQSGPATRWLAGLAGPIVLAAPADWGPVVEQAIARVERFETRTYFDPPRRLPAPPPITRPLRPSDRARFASLVPEWALRSWGDFDALLTHGAGAVVPASALAAETRLLAAAWIFDVSDRYDALAVWTDPAYRRLGLARAACLALLSHIQQDRRKQALWSTNPENQASVDLARALGFRALVHEPLLRWPRRPTAPVAAPDDWSRL